MQAELLCGYLAKYKQNCCVDIWLNASRTAVWIFG